MKAFLDAVFVELVATGIIKIFGLILQTVKNNVDEN